METMKLRIGFHSDVITVEVPAELNPDVWCEIQRKVAEHFLDYANRGEISPAMAGLNPTAESHKVFWNLWGAAVAAQKDQEG